MNSEPDVQECDPALAGQAAMEADSSTEAGNIIIFLTTVVLGLWVDFCSISGYICYPQVFLRVRKGNRFSRELDC
jgi:hypothetical protein